MQIDKTILLRIENSSNKKDIGRFIRLEDILEEVLDIKKLKIYRNIMKHRKECPKWNKEFCLDCFGGGLTKFLEDIKKEFRK